MNVHKPENTQTAPQLHFFASTAKGLEGLLFDELKQLGAQSVKETRAGVYFSGDLAIAYTTCLWSRLANHILYPLHEFDASQPETLYHAMQSVNWSEHMRPNSSFRIDVKGSHTSINNTQFIAQKAKDAIVDQMREHHGERPSIQSEQPDLVLNVFVNKTHFTVSLCLSGDSLHKRGYRLQGGLAPLRETLAAAILMRSGWSERCTNPEFSLLDPMCGSGTIVIEAAMMALDIAPSLNRDYFGFYGWRKHNEALWSEIEEAAEARRDHAFAQKQPKILGCDISPKAIAIASENVERAGLSQIIELKQIDIRDLSHSFLPTENGMIVFNPPYGERLNRGDLLHLQNLFQAAGDTFKREFDGWEMGIITSAPDLLKHLGLRSAKRYKFFNGALAADLLRFHIRSEFTMKYETPDEKLKRQLQNFMDNPSEQSQMFANRLKKNLKHLSRWAKREGVKAYRVYDADLPEFSIAIDLYHCQEGLHIHIQEYQAGNKVNPEHAKQRLTDARLMVHQVFQVSADQIHLKVRQRQKGEQQYERLMDKQTFYAVQESSAHFYVNFEDYLDTGLFLDHRLMRQRFADYARHKSVLNLFAYTCTASVHAALAQAKAVTSVDMSNTYLDWGQRNFDLNGIDSSAHDFIQADCLQWLEKNRIKFDVIFLDPPTFSNSKRMQETLDIQRDHVDLLKLAMQSLKRGGVLLFSNNYRRFKLDPEATKLWQCNDISPACLPEDFKRRPNIHHCFEIRHP